MLTRIVYLSTLSEHTTARQIDAIVERAALFNREQEITGMLALEDRRICQILEGPAHAVDFLYVSIKQDERHFRVTELARHRIFHTSFERWGMVRRPMIDMVTLAFRE
ncbi:MAG: BLUF domain-containing protein [Aliihoeflea sp.]